MVYCKKCGKTYGFLEKVWRCTCGSCLSYSNETVFKAEEIDRTVRSMWRYRRFLPPVKEENIVSLGEGCTPVLQEELFGYPVSLKLDYISASGSFKDRGISLMISIFKEMGIEKLVEDSSGNAGAALATYAAKAGIKCKIYVPAHTSENKLVQIKAMGAEVIPVEGTREDVANAAVSDTDGFYASHNWNQFFIEGIKTVAFEVWEQMGDVPDHVILPMGYGSIVSGAAVGFKELKESKTTDRLPVIHASQAKNCCPMHDYYYHGNEYMEDRISSYRPTMAEGIASLNPIHKEDLKEYLDESRGDITLVTEEEIKEAMMECASKGIFAEPTSAAAVAGFKKLCDAGVIKRKEKSLICLTGWGMKDLGGYKEILG